MKILQVSNNYQQPGGEEEVVNEIYKLLESGGQDVFQYKRSNNELKAYSFLKKVLFPFNTIFSVKSYSAIKELIKSSSIDVMHVHNVMPLISGSSIYAAKHANISVIQHLHNYRLFCANGLMLANGRVCEACLKGNYSCTVSQKCYRDSRVQSAIYAAAIACHNCVGTYKKVNHFIAISEFVKQVYIRYGIPENKITVLHNFISDVEKKDIITNQDLVVYVGRLSPEKGVLTLFKSIALLKNKIRVLLVGDGPQRNILESYTKENLINAEFLGHVPRDKTIDIISSARVLVLPSECYEGFGRVIVEAYACGVPVVASNMGGIPEIMDDGVTGKLFMPNNSADLAEKLDWIFSLQEKQFIEMKKYVHEIAVSRFNKNDYFLKLMELYHQVCK